MHLSDAVGLQLLEDAGEGRAGMTPVESLRHAAKLLEETHTSFGKSNGEALRDLLVIVAITSRVAADCMRSVQMAWANGDRPLPPEKTDGP